ncbi:MAG: NAD(P)-dependent oxidoreductase [bacterium]|nr:NAD(P)-dependent oxidoreductase [bacterium]
MTIVYHQEDASLDSLAGKIVGIVGYGSLARAFALNLRDSGVRVIVSGTPEEQVEASEEGFSVATLINIAPHADILILMLPDEALAEIYQKQISPTLRRGITLILSSAYNLAFGFIEPPPFIDVGLIAPRSTGQTVREAFLNSEGFYSYVAVGQDASGRAWETILALALALGSLQGGAVEVSLEQEAAMTLFVQQAIMPAIHHVMVTGAQLLLKLGYPPEAVLPDLYLSGKFSDFMAQAEVDGLLHALQQLPQSGQYGLLSRLNRFSEIKLERLMEITLEEIRTGDFAQEWKRETLDGYTRLKNLMKQQTTLPLWDLEEQAVDLLRGYEG